jgi:hypothetical protein
VFASVVQVQRHVSKAIDDVLNLDLHSIAAKNLSPFQDGFHAVRFARHQTSSRQAPYDVVGQDSFQRIDVAGAYRVVELSSDFLFSASVIVCLPAN